MKDEIPPELVVEIEKASPPYGTHGYEHTLRVIKTCRHIGKIEKANLSILLHAALLHDIAREDDNHAQASADQARTMLTRYGYSNEMIEEISKAISTHSFSGQRFPKTLEAKILSDADKLDALGTIGIYRTAVYSGEHARSIQDFVNHFNEKLLRLEGLLFTNEAKRMAAERTEYMKEFLERLHNELGQNVRAHSNEVD